MSARTLPARLAWLVLSSVICVTGCASTDGPSPGSPTGRSRSGQALVGMSPNQVQARFGMPSLRRAEPPGDYWRYGIDGCILGVFFYTEPASRQEKVTYYDLRPGSPGPDRCSRLRAELGPNPGATPPG